MNKITRAGVKNGVMISCGWFFIALGGIGVVLPILPTTPFLILALGCFAKSSPRFHQMLLHNRWFGPALKEWEATHRMSRQTKKRSTLMIIATFSISILILSGRPYLQIMLISCATILLFFLWRIKETPRGEKSGHG
ncbi:YbaN family protein [Neptunomonas sp.]|uniref:YbaN family protein n=1 Tax=Neptunomonas sp. TaxID=1971898 RepID=UPI003568EE27